MLRFSAGFAIASILALALISQAAEEGICAPKRMADESVIAEVCDTDTDCMLANGGDGSPAPVTRF